MKKLVIALGASVVVGFVVLGTALAHGPGPVRPATGRVVKIQAGSPAELTIVHIVRGCHNWTDGKTIAEKADVTLHHGGRLTILNQDVDLHSAARGTSDPDREGDDDELEPEAPVREAGSLPVQDRYVRHAGYARDEDDRAGLPAHPPRPREVTPRRLVLETRQRPRPGARPGERLRVW